MELERILRVITQARTGGSVLLLGVGKFALLDAAAAAASTTGYQVVHANGVEFEADIPFRAPPAAAVNDVGVVRSTRCDAPTRAEREPRPRLRQWSRTSFRSLASAYERRSAASCMPCS
jgi:hypothetical protein